MDARYKNSSEVMFNWIKEHNPEFNSSLYEDISKSIESERIKFSRVQNKLIDIKISNIK
jgi:hypothetical protein